MKVSLLNKKPTKVAADLLVIGTDHAWNRQIEALNRACRGKLLAEAKRQGFRGNPGQTLFFQTHDALPAAYILLIGLAKAEATRRWYELAHTAVSRALSTNVRRLAVAVPAARLDAAAVELLTQGFGLSTYDFQEFKATTRSQRKLREATILLEAVDKEARAAVERGLCVAAATCYARDLADRPADVVTPIYLAAEAKRLAAENDLEVRILDEEGIKKARMGALLGVARGSAQPPRFIELIYRPADRSPKRVAIAGKGITFDTGGLSLKTAASMESQKRDMAGGAAALAIMSAVRPLAVRAEVRAYVPAAENMPGSKAIKPGDVLTAANGKTIEVLNTDAEGRLVLADALSYAAAAKPDVLIDLATLTAAVRMALGPRYAAIMGTQPQLVRDIIRAANECDEGLWELPLIEEYRPDIGSLVADIKNTGDGNAGTIIGALFLREFVGSVPWAHIDFSSTVMTDKPRACHPRGASGFGVRTLLRYLRGL
jgi:leucyl aminopeptidase